MAAPPGYQRLGPFPPPDEEQPAPGAQGGNAVVFADIDRDVKRQVIRKTCGPSLIIGTAAIREHNFTHIRNATTLTLLCQQSLVSHVGWVSYFYKFFFGAMGWSATSYALSHHAVATLLNKSFFHHLLGNIAVGLGGSLAADFGTFLWIRFHRIARFFKSPSRMAYGLANLFALSFPFDFIWESADTPISTHLNFFEGWVSRIACLAIGASLSIALYYGLPRCFPKLFSKCCASDVGKISVSMELLTSLILGGVGFAVAVALSTHFHFGILFSILMNGCFTGISAQFPALYGHCRIRQRQPPLAAVGVLCDLYEDQHSSYSREQLMNYLRNSLSKLTQPEHWNVMLALFKRAVGDRALMRDFLRDIEQRPLQAFTVDETLQRYALVVAPAETAARSRWNRARLVTQAASGFAGAV